MARCREQHKLRPVVVVTKPCDETRPTVSAPEARCGHCHRRLPPSAATGRPKRWCSNACRQIAYRHRRTAPVTKPRDETSCGACGQSVEIALVGRRAQWCSRACRTRAWRNRCSTLTQPVYRPVTPLTLAMLHQGSGCRDIPTDLFFTAGFDGRPPPEVTKACGGCDLKVECLAYALDGGETGNPRDVYGVWGGTTEAEREKLLRFVRRVKCPLCLGASLRALPQAQVCLGCGQSWPTIRPGAHPHTRLKAEAAA